LPAPSSRRPPPPHQLRISARHREDAVQFNPAAALDPSAAACFNFIDQTWLGTVKEAGSQLGTATTPTHHQILVRQLSVSDPTTRAAILKLRDIRQLAPPWRGC